MKVDVVDPTYGGGVITAFPRAQRIADAIVFYEYYRRPNLGEPADVTVYELVHKYGLADVLGSYSYTGRRPINVADQVVRNALNESPLWYRTHARRKGYVVFEAKWASR